MIFWATDFADDTDFTQIEFLMRKRSWLTLCFSPADSADCRWDFWTADFADDADFTQIEFLDAQAHELTRIGWRK